MRFCSLALVGLFVLGMTGEAVAQKLTREQVQEARRHYKAAIAAAKKQDFDTAVTEYKAAFGITKDAKLHYQIATTLETAGHLKEAVTSYQAYMDLAKLSRTARQRIGDKIYELNEQLAAAAETAEPETTGTSETTLAGDADRTGAAGAQLGDLDFDSRAESPPPFLETKHGWQRTAGWVTLGVAAAFGTTAGVLAASARSRQGDLSRLTEFRDPSTQLPSMYQGTVSTRYQDAVKEGTDLDRFALMAAIGAGATAGIAVVFFVLERPVTATTGSEQVIFMPTLSDDSVGIGASWEF